MFGEHETDAVKLPPKAAPWVLIVTNQPVATELEVKMLPSASVLKPPLTATIPLGQLATTESTVSIPIAFDASTRTRR